MEVLNRIRRINIRESILFTKESIMYLKTWPFWQNAFLYLAHVLFMIYSLILLILSLKELTYHEYQLFFGAIFAASLVKLIATIIGIYAFATRRNYLIFYYSIFLVILLCFHFGFLSYLWIHIKRKRRILERSDLNLQLLRFGGLKYSEIRYKCCGYRGWRDYFEIKEYVPISCCGFYNSGICRAAIYSKRPGCSKALLNALKNQIIPMRDIYISVVVTEVFLLIMLLVTTIRSRRVSLESGTSTIISS